MTFQPGKSGNPLGRNLEKIAADSLRIVALEKITKKGNHKGKIKLRRINEKIMEAALRASLGPAKWCSTASTASRCSSSKDHDHQAGDVFIEMLRASTSAEGK